MKISIKCRWNDKILFEGEFASTKEALIKAAADGANLYGANLVRANLVRANLDGANLDGANLDGANLDGAKILDEILVISPIQIGGLRWGIFITPLYMKIGCERHTHKDWRAFTRDKISQMDHHAWDWWKLHKPMLMLACELQESEAAKIVKSKIGEAEKTS